MVSMLFQPFYSENLIGGDECADGHVGGMMAVVLLMMGGNQRPMWFVRRPPFEVIKCAVGVSQSAIGIIFLLPCSPLPVSFLGSSIFQQRRQRWTCTPRPLVTENGSRYYYYYWGMFVKIAHWIDIGIIVQLEWLSPAAQRSHPRPCCTVVLQTHITTSHRRRRYVIVAKGASHTGIRWDERTHGPEEDINCPLGRKRDGESVVFGKGMYMYFFN